MGSLFLIKTELDAGSGSSYDILRSFNINKNFFVSEIAYFNNTDHESKDCLFAASWADGLIRIFDVDSSEPLFEY